MASVPMTRLMAASMAMGLALLPAAGFAQAAPHPAAASPAAARQELHAAAMRTASAELGYAKSDLQADKLVSARAAIGTAEVAILNDHELAQVMPGEHTRAGAYETVLDHTVKARGDAMKADKAAAEQHVAKAIAALQAIPAA